ncbi:MAG: hypothetical protein N2038_02330 [Geminicoccaceae bacterium]|nr:hypothetical protein [Geminicoccaceae bacterium]MCX7629067.1 hypothetical protein [Geminicoccaceae bacterium]MDW8124699.1 hypothetical protein [Geminicoccaceae bacterium]MDW8341536.1 hypothetical protein [Geminicoccaceae bacterium]
MAQEARPDLLLEAWKLVAEKGWRGFSPIELARRTGRPLPEIYAVFTEPRDLLRALGHRLDAAMLDVPLAELERLSVRERLFELLMRRFEAMRPFRDGLAAAGREVWCDPALLCGTIANLERGSYWLLEASEAGLSGIWARLGRCALQIAYVRVFRVFLEDDTADLSRTMAELDKRLGELESLARFAGFARPARPAPEAPAGGTEGGEAPASA